MREADLWLLHAGVEAKARGLAWAAEGAVSLGSALIVAVAAVALAAYGFRRFGVAATVEVAATLALAIVASRVVKELAAHPHLASRSTDRSIGSEAWPSGHAAATAALALLGWHLLGGRGRAAVVLPLVYAMVVGWGLVATNSHYPSDVLGGWGVAVTCFALVVAGVWRRPALR